MEFPDLYRKVGVLSKKNAILCLEEFTGSKKWKENARILDLGCGDGSTNREVLQRFAPASCRQIVGCDISEKMVDYAKAHYGSELVDFLVWDVSLEPPLKLKGAFDHVFSFYVLHWVKQKKTVLLNIYDTIAEGGNCLLVFLGYYVVHDVFLKLSRKDKWADDLKDVETFVSAYYYSQDPKAEVTSLMEAVGFKDVQVQVHEKVYSYENTEAYKNLVQAINPFGVLNEKWEEFMEDYFHEAPSPVTVDYTLIVAYGSK